MSAPTCSKRALQYGKVVFSRCSTWRRNMGKLCFLCAAHGAAIWESCVFKVQHMAPQYGKVVFSRCSTWRRNMGKLCFLCAAHGAAIWESCVFYVQHMAPQYGKVVYSRCSTGHGNMIKSVVSRFFNYWMSWWILVREIKKNFLIIMPKIEHQFKDFVPHFWTPKQKTILT